MNDGETGKRGGEGDKLAGRRVGFDHENLETLKRKHRAALVRVRVLDEKHAIGGLLDIATSIEELARLRLAVQRVFVTENEVNGLAFPPAADSLVIFGLGYRVDRLGAVSWLNDVDVHTGVTWTRMAFLSSPVCGDTFRTRARC